MNIERKLIEDLHAHEECPVEFIDHLRRALDKKGDDLSFQLKDREGSRRDWFDEAQRLQVELAERDALLEDWHAANAAGEVKVSDKAYRIVTRTAAALSASAEPSAPVERDDREDFELYRDRRNAQLVSEGASGQWLVTNAHYATWQARAAMDCADCGDTGLEPCSKHGVKP